MKLGLTQDSWNNEPLQAQRSRRNEDLRDILRNSCTTQTKSPRAD